LSSDTTLRSAASSANTFQQTLLGLTYDTGMPADLFSRACVEQYAATDPNHFGYRFAQVFETDVLWEVTRLAGADFESVTDLDERPTPQLVVLGESIDRVVGRDGARGLNTVHMVNAAAALISISRFAVANRVLDVAAARAGTPREAFEIAMLRFVSCNRVADGASIQRAFADMRRAIETGELPHDRAMDACAQAVVWYLKNKAISEDEFAWFSAYGNALAAEPAALGAATRSSWYRAWAMVPAVEGDRAATRDAMQQARAAADEAVAASTGAYETHLVKTYYESSLKEHMYVSRDLALAEEAGQALIDLDPVWAPSHGELGEAYAFFGQPEKAAQLYETAIHLGPPYVAYHTLAAARCRERSGDLMAAVAHYESLGALAPASRRVMTDGLEVARRAGARAGSAQDYFALALARLDAGRAASDDRGDR
jgi:hypothetical protein